jgi:hypothetical protein
MAKRVKEPPVAAPKSVVLRGKWKLPISLLLVLHLLAVVAEPFSLFTRGANGPSAAASPIRGSLAPYVEFAYLDHGYFFFAPNPAPSHLLECSLKSASGEQSRLRLPDLRAQWPRLLYHRHFMLAEFLHQLHFEPITEQDIANTPNKDLLNAWRTDRARFEMVRDSMIKHLKHRYAVDSAEIFRLEHRLPSDVEVFRDKLSINDERLYVVLPDSSLMAPPTPIAELIPEAGDSQPILNSKAVSPEQVAP